MDTSTTWPAGVMANGLSEEGASAGATLSVLLVGFMASGKTAVGAELARISGMPRVEVDREIESAAGATVSEIFRDRGEAWFRREEDRRTRRALDQRGVVVVPGGGWAAAHGRMESLPAHVVSVWLRVTPETAVVRAARDGATRPLLEEGEGRLDRVRELMEHREPFYRLATLHLDTEGRKPLELAGEILEHLRREQSRRTALDSE